VLANIGPAGSVAASQHLSCRTASGTTFGLGATDGPWQTEAMATYKVVPGRRAGDGWLVVLDVPGQHMNVIRSFETLAEARAEAARLAAADESVTTGDVTDT